MDSICPPALIYLAFSLTQIVIDTFKGLYNTAFLKFIVMITITFLLNALCQGGMSIISWVLVFIPFIFMTVIVAILLYVFGLDAATGTLNFKCDSTNTDPNSNLIYSSSTTPYANTNTCSNTSNTNTNTTSSVNSPSTSSDPQYQ
jgi:ABC-type bacteriocin/lantibiotic exporter with double-glycine peptidase domain